MIADLIVHGGEVTDPARDHAAALPATAAATARKQTYPLNSSLSARVYSFFSCPCPVYKKSKWRSSLGHVECSVGAKRGGTFSSVLSIRQWTQSAANAAASATSVRKV